MTQIPKGAHVPVPPQALHVAVSWRTGHGVPDVDVSALLLGAGSGCGTTPIWSSTTTPSTLRGPSGTWGSRRRARPGSPAADWLWLDLARVEPDVGASGDRRLRGRGRLRAGAGAGRAGHGRGREPGGVLRDRGRDDGDRLRLRGVLRRDGGWRFRAVGQGYASGLAGLATDFGIVVESPPPPIPGPGYVPPPPPPAPAAPPVPVSDPYGGEFRPAVYQGRGKETVHCDPALPAGHWVLLEIESYHSLSTTIESCDAYGRAEDYLLTAYEDDVRARTVALVPRARPLTLRVDADTPWTLRVLPLSHARRFDSHAEGLAHDLVIYEGPAGCSTSRTSGSPTSRSTSTLRRWTRSTTTRSRTCWSTRSGRSG
ncbi:TerD family protein [Streptomyces tanashiensis]